MITPLSSLKFNFLRNIAEGDDFKKYIFHLENKELEFIFDQKLKIKLNEDNIEFEGIGPLFELKDFLMFFTSIGIRYYFGEK